MTTCLRDSGEDSVFPYRRILPQLTAECIAHCFLESEYV
jgi:hypothetical protein